MLDPDLVTWVRTEYGPSTGSGQAGRAMRQYNGEGELMVELEYLDFRVTKVHDAFGNEQIRTYSERNALRRQEDPPGR